MFHNYAGDFFSRSTQIDYDKLAQKLGSKSLSSARGSWCAVKKKLTANAPVASSTDERATGKPKTPRKKGQAVATKATPKAETKNKTSDDNKKGKPSAPGRKKSTPMSRIEATDSDIDQDMDDVEADADDNLTDENKLIKSEVEDTENDKPKDVISVEIPISQNDAVTGDDEKASSDALESAPKTVAPLTPETSPVSDKSVSPIQANVENDAVEADKKGTTTSATGAKSKSAPTKTPAKKTPSKQTKKAESAAASTTTAEGDTPKSTPKKRSRPIKAETEADEDDPTSDAGKPAPKKQRKTPVKKKAAIDETADPDSPVADTANIPVKKATPKTKRLSVAEKRKQAKLDEEAEIAAEEDAEKAALAAKKKAENAAAMEANDVLTGKKKVETKNASSMPAQAKCEKDKKDQDLDAE